jgi:paired amphipathic helix protein Sin3a
MYQPHPEYEGGYPSNFQGHSTTAAASYLGNLNNRNPVEQQSDQFQHAIEYLNKIKARYSDDPNTYKQFLDILQTHQKEQKQLHNVSRMSQMTLN